MFFYKNKNFYKLSIIVVAIVIVFNSTITAYGDVVNNIIDDDYKEEYYIYSTKEYLKKFDESVAKAVAKAPKLDLSIEEEMVLQKARSNGLVYVSYPGILSLGDKSPNIEQFNLEFIKQTLGIDIKFTTLEDYGFDDKFENVEILLESGLVDLAGFYNYNNNLSIAKEKGFYSSKPYSKQRLYQVSRVDNDFKQVNLYTDNVAISENVLYVNNLDVINKNTIVTDNLAYGVDVVYQKLNDYFIAEADVVPHVAVKNNLTYTPINDINLSPNLSIISTNEKYETLLNIISKLYTGAVLEEFFNVSEEIIYRNRYTIFEEIYNDADFKFLNYDNEITVGFYEAKGIIEHDENGKLQGFVIDYMEEIAYIAGVRFKFVDYTNKNVATMVADLSTGQIDVIAALPYELRDEYQAYVKEKNVNLIFSKPYFDKKLNVLKHVQTPQLNYLEDMSIAKVGYDVHNKEIVEDFVGEIFGGLDLDYLQSYQNSTLLLEALENKEVNYTIGLPGEKVHLIRNGKKWTDYAYDYESDIGINSYKFSFVTADVNYRSKEIIAVLNSAINAVHDKKHNIWFIESVSYQEIVNISDLNNILTFGILGIIILAITIAVVVYMRTRKAKSSIYEMIKIDKISGLGNRYAFFEDIKIKEKEYYCIIVSVNNTKGFFENLGKLNITPMLRAIGSRITQMTTDIEFGTYRLAGEEFVILVEHVDIERFKKFLTLLFANINMTYQLMDMELNIDFNIGVCESKYANKDTKKMLLYAKNMVQEHSKNKELEYVMFNNKDKSEIEEIEVIEGYINSDLSKCIVPYFQPILDEKENKIIGVEVLARLIANNTIYNADKFIDIAYKNDKISHIDQLMIEETIKIREYLLERKHIDKDFHFSVNLSYDFIKRFDISQLINFKYMNNVLDLKFLQVEVSEEFLSMPETEKMFDLLESENVRIAVDDFSIGHSSLARIIERDFAVVKIDKNLLLSELDETNKQLYTSLVDMLIGMKQYVISHGVQSKTHHHFLEGVNVNAKQGYYYSKALSTGELITYINNIEKK